MFLLGLYFLVPFGLSAALDPSPGILSPYGASSDRECRYVSEEAARQEFAGLLGESAARGSLGTRTFMACRNRVVGRNDRPVRDDVILSALSEQVPELARRVRARAPENTLWIVEAEHPSAPIAEKIAFAAKVALVQDKAEVADRGPVPSAEAVQRLQPLAMKELLPAACQALAPGLAERERILTLFLMAPQETQLHAGLCAPGGWEWVL